MPIEVRIKALHMSDGTIVDVPPGGVVVFVGPNNSGKSTALRDIINLLVNGPGDVAPKVVKQLDVVKSGTDEELKEWLDEHCSVRERDGFFYYSRHGSSETRLDSLKEWWAQGPPFHRLGNFLTYLANAQQRLGAADSVQSIDFANDRPTHPLHLLYQFPEREEELNSISQEAFGESIVLNRISGSQIHLQVGKPPPWGNKPQVPSERFRKGISRLPNLSEHGDGMKSFIGLMLHVSFDSYPVVAVDEPEAFLHPPQAHLLGKRLIRDKRPETTLFLGTHDSDILKGALDAGNPNITVVRLVRDGSVNRTAQLEPSLVRELWRDPLLRYSNLLDGLFHEAVVIGESDADCRFYASLLDAPELQEVRDSVPQVLFAHCGGMHRIPVAVRAMKAVDVPVRVIVDFDALRDKQPLKAIVEALGGVWNEVEPSWFTVKAALDQDKKPLRVDFLRQEITAALDAESGVDASVETLRRIKDLARPDTGWSRAKRTGLSGVPQGDAYERCEALMSDLAKIGLFVVPVGELERFAPNVPGHGPSWVSSVQEQELHLDSALKPAHQFVKRVMTSLTP